MSRKTVKAVALLFVIALLLPTLAACQTAQVSEPETIIETVVVTEKEYVEVTPTPLPAPVKEGGPVFIGTNGMTAKHYNPIWLTCNPQFLTFPLILPALTWFDNNIQPVPDLAESIDVNEDATVYTFHLPENAEWSDGTPLTANDVYFTYKLVLTPGVGAGSWNSNFATIKGVEDYQNGEADEIEGIVVVDDHTVQMELTAPNAVFLTKTYLGILPEHILGGLSAEELETADYVDNPTITSGPYEFVEYKEDQYIKFVKKDNYWGKQVNLDEVYVKIFESNATMLAQLEAGEIDIAMLPPEEVARFEEIDYINAIEVQGVGYYVTHIDARTEEQVQAIRDAGAWEVPEDYEIKPYLQDARFRQALAYALDTNAFIAVVEEGQATPIYSPIFGPEWAVNPDLNTYERDLDKSRALMEEVGVTFNDKGTALWEDKPIELVFLTTSSEKKRLFGEVLQQQFGEVGIRLDIKMVTSSAFIAAAVAGEGDLIQNAGGRFGADPSVSEAYYSCTAGWGTLVTGYCNEAFDALMTEGVAVSDVDTRATTYHEASAILNEDLPSLFFYTSSSFTGVNAGLTGVMPSADPGYLTWNIEDWAFTE
jgi:peptide/nickel transport system substrate-binding protein